MRITIRLDPEVAAAAERLRRERHIGLGEAVNELARAGLAQDRSPMARDRRPLARDRTPARFRQHTASVGLRVDVTDVAASLELLDQHDTEDSR